MQLQLVGDKPMCIMFYHLHQHISSSFLAKLVKNYLQVVLKETYRYIIIIILPYWYVTFETPCIKPLQ